MVTRAQQNLNEAAVDRLPARRRLTLNPEAERWLPEITRRLVERFDPLAIVLFGSQARGDATRHSDIDLLVVMRSVTVRREAAAAMYASLAGIPAPTDIHVVSAADVERYHDAIGTIVRPALAEGALLYAAA